MKHLFLPLFILSFLTQGSAQQYYPIFTQHYANPYTINPSLITLDRRPEVNATFRQQWSGITDGPKTYQLDFQYPIDPRISVGVNLYNDKTVLLSSSGALATFGYKVRLASQHILGFGLSGGFVSNQIDLDGVPDIDLVDPVLLKSTNNFDFDSQFGMHYRNRNFVIGFSLLKLIDNRPFSDGSVQQDKFDPFTDKAALMSYTFNLSHQISLQPFVYYRSTFSGIDYFEGSLLVNFKNILSIGGGYRVDFGPHAVIRLRFKDLHAGYSYDLPTKRYGSSTENTNEFQLKFQFGRETEPLITKIKKDTAKVVEGREEVSGQEDFAVDTSEQDDDFPVEAIEQNENSNEVSEYVSNQVVDATPPTLEPVVKEKKAEVIEGPAYQLVIGVFSKRSNAERYAKNLIKEGVNATVKDSRETPYFYVIAPEYATQTITLERILELRNDKRFAEAWFKRLD